MSACNDLIGLAYGWSHRPGDGSGKTDCFQLVCEVRRRLELTDYAPEFEWVYRSYSEATFPRIRLIRWLMERCTRTTEPTPGDVWIKYSDCPDVAGVFPTVITARSPNPVVLAFAIFFSLLLF